jgi:hypothetical protein
MTDHEHEWEKVDVCSSCGMVREQDYLLVRLARYVSPSVTSSDNLESATFDLYETANMGTD